MKINTEFCTVICSYGGGAWGTSITNGTLFTSTYCNWTNYWVYLAGTTSGWATNCPVSCQQIYINNTVSPITATLCFCVDGFCNALYINNVNIVNLNVYNWPNTNTLSITLLPGTNIIDFHCNNMALSTTGGGGAGGLIFYVKDSTTNAKLCQSDANVKCRLL